jgi:Flp pilus assembly protein TadG
MREMKPTKRMQRERGSALVEGALICMAFFYMLLGAIDFGQFLYIHQTLTERAREGVRYGAVNTPTDSTSIQNVVLYGQASGGSVPTSPQSTDKGIFNVLRSDVTVTAAGSATDDYRLTVEIKNYSYTMYSPIISGSYTGPNIFASLPLGINYQ